MADDVKQFQKDLDEKANRDAQSAHFLALLDSEEGRRKLASCASRKLASCLSGWVVPSQAVPPPQGGAYSSAKGETEAMCYGVYPPAPHTPDAVSQQDLGDGFDTLPVVPERPPADRCFQCDGLVSGGRSLCRGCREDW